MKEGEHGGVVRGQVPNAQERIADVREMMGNVRKRTPDLQERMSACESVKGTERGLPDARFLGMWGVMWWIWRGREWAGQCV